jgi:aminoglycoside phosphotransferase (APT) family kinase protein
LLTETLTTLSSRPWPESISKKPLTSRVAAFIPANQADALAGRTLAHTDASAFNVIVTNGEVRLLDWAMACPGPAWADSALMIPRLIATGHTLAQAEQVARQVPAYADADPRHLAIFARTIHAFWQHRTNEAPLPHRATLLHAAQVWALTDRQGR